MKQSRSLYLGNLWDWMDSPKETGAFNRGKLSLTFYVDKKGNVRFKKRKRKGYATNRQA